MKFYPFGINKEAEGGSVNVLGGKGAGLVWLSNEGVPVPPGFVIPTTVWAEYDKKPKTTMKAIAKALPGYLAALEAHFGYMPLLSVRSGARVSCPGMMDTILNVGLDEHTIPAWTQRLGVKCFADSFHRLVTMYGSVVKGLRKESLAGDDLKAVLDAYLTQTGEAFPDAQAQLLGAIEAVFKSWDNQRADEYRQLHGYDRAWGTAVTVQAMVFGNLNDQSGTGVLFSRNPNTGFGAVTGEYLFNAQGEDIVAGIRTPLPLMQMQTWNADVFLQLMDLVHKLETAKREMLDIEFTIQDGTLYLLQVRSGKRTATAAIKIALDMMKEGLIDDTTAVKRVSARQFDLAQLATLDPAFTKAPAFIGIPACDGVVTGKPVFTKEDAISAKVPVILVTQETTPDDIMGMKAAVGVVTMVGGLTSHAAVVARGMDRACIVGVGQDIEAFKDIEVLSFDGGTGRIWAEAVPIIGGQTNGLIHEFSHLVASTLGIVPIIFKTPMYAMPEALLYLGDQVLNPAKAAATVLETLTQVNRLYLDLVPTEGEQKFLNILAAHDHTARVLARLALALPEGHEARTRLVVIADEKYPFSFARIVPGTDLRSIVLSDTVTLSGVDVTDPAIQRVLAWKVAEGATVVSIGAMVHDSNVKNMISISQALQVVGNGGM